MRVFVTGASGWIGSALVPDLLASGHDVVGLARDDVTSAAIVATGAEVVRGTLDDLDVLQKTADAADGVIHLAFRHDLAFSGDFPGAAQVDRRAIDAIGEALVGSERPLVVASGTLGVSPGRLATERDGHGPGAGDGFFAGASARAANAEATLGFAERGVRSSVVRLAPTVHGDGDHGFMATLVAIARDRGVSGYIGDGANRWPAIHRLDAARLFRLAVESAPAGSTLHGIAEEGVTIRSVAEAIGRGCNVPVVAVPPDTAPAHFSWLAGFLGANAPASNTLTRELLDWTPTHPGLIEDLDAGFYFRT